MADFSTLKARYKSALKKLYPSGWAFTFNPGSVFDKFLDATRGMDAERAKTVYQTIDDIRAENRAQVWIEGYRHHVRDPVALLLRRAAAREENGHREERRKAELAEGRRRAAENG